MKIVLFKTTDQDKHEPSLNLALSFLQDKHEVFADYPLNITHEHSTFTELSTEELTNILNTDEPILLATSSTIFTAEAFTDTAGAYHHFSQNEKIMLQLTRDDEYLQYPAPTILYYGGRRLWSSSNRLFDKYPIIYTIGSTIFKLLTNTFEKQPFNDGIFKGGDTMILSSLPPLAFNMDKNLPVQISSAAFDAQAYIANIPVFNQPTEE